MIDAYLSRKIVIRQNRAAKGTDDSTHVAGCGKAPLLHVFEGHNNLVCAAVWLHHDSRLGVTLINVRKTVINVLHEQNKDIK